MSERQKIFLVIPSFNEGRVLQTTLKPLTDNDYSVVVVDDGSSDETESLCAALPIHYVKHPVNLGQGAALETGTKYALLMGAEFIVHFDADGQHPAGYIPNLLAPLYSGKADVALGSRFLEREHSKLVPPMKFLLLKCGVFVNWFFTGAFLTDTHNGFRAMTAAAASRIHLEEPGFSHATEILVKIRRASLRYTEVAVPIVYTDYSIRKGQSLLNSVSIVIDLLLRRVIR